MSTLSYRTCDSEQSIQRMLSHVSVHPDIAAVVEGAQCPNTILFGAIESNHGDENLIAAARVHYEQSLYPTRCSKEADIEQYTIEAFRVAQDYQMRRIGFTLASSIKTQVLQNLAAVPHVDRATVLVPIPSELYRQHIKEAPLNVLTRLLQEEKFQWRGKSLDGTHDIVCKEYRQADAHRVYKRPTSVSHGTSI